MALLTIGDITEQQVDQLLQQRPGRTSRRVPMQVQIDPGELEMRIQDALSLLGSHTMSYLSYRTSPSRRDIRLSGLMALIKMRVQRAGREHHDSNIDDSPEVSIIAVQQGVFDPEQDRAGSDAANRRASLASDLLDLMRQKTPGLEVYKIESGQVVSVS